MAKTERRKKWEESLPERHKVLRLHLQVLKDSIKLDKKALRYAKDEERIAFLKRSVNAQKVIIRALRNELGYNMYPRVKPFSVGFHCRWCGQMVEFRDGYCSRCGKELNWLDVTVGVYQAILERAKDYLIRGHIEFMRKFQRTKETLEAKANENKN